MSTEDAIPEDYKYCWTPSGKMSLDEFLAEHKPKNIRNDTANSKPFIWVCKVDNAKKDAYSDAVQEAKTVLEDITKEIIDVKENKDIPLRANKKKGVKSKKEVREEIQAKATEKFAEIAKNHGFVRGKWLAFADAFQVNALFERLAHSLISGDLSKTSAVQVRVSTHPLEDPENGAPNRHNLAVEIPDVYNAEQAKEVMETLLKDQGLKLSGAKADLYTAIGLNSKHASGIQSTIWKGMGGPGSLMSEKEVQDLRSEHWEEARGVSTAKPVKGAAPKQKAADEEDNPFASEDEEVDKAPKSKAMEVGAKPKSKGQGGSKSTAETGQKRTAPDSESDSEGNEPPKKVAKTTNAGAAGRKPGPKPKVPVKKRKEASSDEDSS